MFRPLPRNRRLDTPGRLLATVIVGGLLAVPVKGQDPQPQDEPQVRFGEVVEVHILEIDVLVESFGGKPLLDLRKEDFEVYEDGERREIVAFEPPRAVAEPPVVTGRAGAPSPGSQQQIAEVPPPHDIVLAFDTESVDIVRLARALPDIEAFVRRNAAANRRWAVVILGGNPYAITDWTSDPDRVVEGLRRASSALNGHATPSWGVTSFLVQADVEAWEQRTAALLGEESGVGGDAQSRLDEGEDRRARNSREFLERIASCGRWSGTGTLATALSTRALLRSIVARSGVRSLALFYVDNAAPAPRRLTAECMSAAARVKQGWQDTARVAQSLRFQTYGIDLAGLNGVQASGEGFAGESVEGSLEAISTLGVSDAIRMTGVLTGGRDLHTNDWTAGLRRALDDARARYSLAVRVPHAHDGEEHRIEIEVKGHRGAHLRYRRRYTDLSRRQLLQSQLAGSGNVPRAGGSFPLSFEVETVTASRDRPAAVSARLTAPLARLGLRKRPDGSGEVEVESWLAIYSTATGERTALHRIPSTLRIPPEELAGAESATYSQVFELALQAGDWSLVGAVYSPTEDTAAVATRRIRIPGG